MKETDLFTSTVLLQEKIKQYKNLQQDKKHAFSEYEKQMVRENESRIYKELFSSSDFTPYSESSRDSNAFSEIETLEGTIETHDSKVCISNPSVVSASNTINTGIENRSTFHRSDAKFSKNQNFENFSKYDIRKKLELEAHKYSSAIKKSDAISPTKEETKTFSYTAFFFTIAIFLRIGHEFSSRQLLTITMGGFNFFALIYTFFSIKLDIDQKVVEWVNSTEIGRNYKESLKKACSRSTWMRLCFIVGVLFALFISGSYFGFFDLFNDVLTILALAASLSNGWLAQKQAYHIETLALKNRPIK